MARTPVLSSATLTPFGGGGGGFGAFNIINPGQQAYLEFLKVKVRWDNGEISNAEYLAAYEVYVGKLSGSTKVNAQQSLDETRYRLERNDLLNEVEFGNATWGDLLVYDREHLDGLNTESQQYLDRLQLFQSTQARELNEAATEQHTLYEAGKITTAQLRAWYVARSIDPDLALNPDLADQITKQVQSLDLRLTSEADAHMIQLYSDGKVGVDAFLAYASSAKARYTAGTEDANRWDKIISDAKAQIAERSLTYRYGLSQDYIQLQKFIKNEEDLIARSATGGSSTSTSERIVLGADGNWKVVTSTKTTPYKPSAAEVAAMKQRRIELADAKAQLAEWTAKITSSGGFVTTDEMIGFYSGRQAEVVKGTDEWYQLQTRLDQLQQQKHVESVLQQEGVRISFNPNVTTSVRIGTSGTTSGASGAGGGGARTSGGVAAPSGSAPKASSSGPLQVITGTTSGYERDDPGERLTRTTTVTTQSSRFPTNLDGSAFQKFYSGMIAAFKAGETAFTDYSSGKPITYYIPEDLAARAEMIATLDDMRISYYALRAQQYAGTASEYVASDQYSKAIKDKADNAYLILVTSQRGGQVLDIGESAAQGTPILDPIAQGLAVRDQAKAYYAQQVKLAQEAWARGDITNAWAHLQLATRTAAETEAKMRVYLSSAQSAMNSIYKASGQTAPDSVVNAFAELADWKDAFSTPMTQASKLTDDVYKWVKVGSTGQPVYSADGTLSLHDGAAMFLTPDGKVGIQEVPSAGYSGVGSTQQVPDVPGFVRVTVNLGGTVPNQTVYAKWTVGIVGYTANGLPLMGKVVSGFLNGQRYTLVEDPFHPGKWSLGNQTFKAPTTFAATQTEGVYAFTQNGANYLMVFDSKAGRYNLVKPGDAFSIEQTIPVSEADGQALLESAGFGLDLSTVDPADRWKYNMAQPYAGFSKTEWQQFTTPPPSILPNASGSPDDRAERAGQRLPSLNTSGSPDDRDAARQPAKPSGQLFSATGIPFVDETAESLRLEKFGIAPKKAPEPPPPSSDWAAQQAAAQQAAKSPVPLVGLSSLDTYNDLMAEKRLAALRTTQLGSTLKLTSTPNPAPTPTSSTTVRSGARTTTTTTKTPTPTTKTPTTQISPVPTYTAEKQKILEFI